MILREIFTFYMPFPSDSPFPGGVDKFSVGLFESPVKFLPICFLITKFCFLFCSPCSLSFAGDRIVPTNVEGDSDVVRKAEVRDGPPVADAGLPHLDGEVDRRPPSCGGMSQCWLSCVSQCSPVLKKPFHNLIPFFCFDYLFAQIPSH